MIIDLSFVDILKGDGIPPEQILETLVKAVSVANEKQRQFERARKRKHRCRLSQGTKPNVPGDKIIQQNQCPRGQDNVPGDMSQGTKNMEENQTLNFGTKVAILPIVKKERKKDILLIVPGDMSDFDTFWKAYPRKEGKRNAMKSYQKAIKQVAPDKLLSSLVSQISRPGFDPKFFPHAATWLNGARWEDEAVPVDHYADIRRHLAW